MDTAIQWRVYCPRFRNHLRKRLVHFFVVSRVLRRSGPVRVGLSNKSGPAFHAERLAERALSFACECRLPSRSTTLCLTVLTTMPGFDHDD